MTDDSLTPTLALAYLRELSLDVRAALVLDGAGELLAGDAALLERARAALAAGVDGGARVVRSGGETLVVAQVPGGVAIAVAAGPQALLPLLAHDVERVLGELA